MRVHPVVVERLEEGETAVYGDEGHHLARVLRVRTGDHVRAFDGRGREASGVVQGVERDRVSLELGPSRRSEAEPHVAVTLAVALLKGDKLADVVRMGTELGVARFLLLVTRHSELEDLSRSKTQRLERIAREAAKQSGRAVIPPIEGPAALSDAPVDDTALVADPRADTPVIARVRGDRHASSTAVSALVSTPTFMTLSGPEGGFAPDEVDDLVRRGATRVSLGRSILRAETAAVVLASAVLLGSA